MPGLTMPPSSLQPTRPGIRLRRPAARSAQRGAATLVVVMVLFFIVALVAAYTSRNLIFEQRTSANQYRSTQALEAAEAGLEWALAMLNSGRIDAACQPHPLANAATLDTSFRDRYLAIDVDTGRITAPPRAGGEPRRAACVFDGTNWQCSCPADAAPALADPAGNGPFPAFVLQFYDLSPDVPPAPYPAGVVRIESTGCTRLDAAGICAAGASAGDGRATVTVLAALRSALVTPPAAAMTVRRDLDLGVNMLEAVNRDASSGGLTLHVGRTISGTPHDLQGPPGTPGQQSVFEDAAMGNINFGVDRMFNSVFGMGRDTYRLQPAAVFIDCAVDCSATTVRDMARLNPGRVLWINGNFALNIADPIGTVASPVLLVVVGDMSIANAGAQLNGVVYTSGNAWGNTGALTLNGALFGETDLALAGGGRSTVVYDPDVLKHLRRSSGSFVRVPGSWRDF
jgi:hypothetical protein